MHFFTISNRPSIRLRESNLNRRKVALKLAIPATTAAAAAETFGLLWGSATLLWLLLELGWLDARALFFFLHPSPEGSNPPEVFVYTNIPTQSSKGTTTQHTNTGGPVWNGHTNTNTHTEKGQKKTSKQPTAKPHKVQGLAKSSSSSPLSWAGVWSFGVGTLCTTSAQHHQWGISDRSFKCSFD